METNSQTAKNQFEMHGFLKSLEREVPRKNETEASHLSKESAKKSTAARAKHSSFESRNVGKRRMLLGRKIYVRY